MENITAKDKSVCLPEAICHAVAGQHAEQDYSHKQRSHKFPAKRYNTLRLLIKFIGI